jgi:hypothetical protein
MPTLLRELTASFESVQMPLQELPGRLQDLPKQLQELPAQLRRHKIENAVADRAIVKTATVIARPDGAVASVDFSFCDTFPRNCGSCRGNCDFLADL